MSTRGSVGFIHKGQYRGTYNHFDSYPDGLGQECVDQIQQITDWDKFKENYEQIKWVDGEYTPTEQEIEQNKKWANTGVSTGKLTEVYCLLREMQGAVCIGAIRKGEVTLMLDNSAFINDSTFCEYAYVLNMDDEKFEVYTDKSDKLGEFPLRDIPEDWIDQVEGEDE